MIRLSILTGKQAGTPVDVRRFPFLVGRSRQCHLSIEDDGLWRQHFRLEREAQGRIEILAEPEVGSVSVNGRPRERVVLRNGDVIAAGAFSARFGLSPLIQRPLAFHEPLVMALVLGLVMFQGWLILRFAL